MNLGSRSQVESLESRCLLAVIPPTITEVKIQSRDVPDQFTNRLYLRFTDTNTTESAYEVQRSPDGVSAWEFAGTVPASDPPSSTGSILLYNEVLDAGQDLNYRIRALETGGNPSDWSAVVTPNTPKDRVVQLEASAGANGITLKWPDDLPHDRRTVSWSVFRKLRTDSDWGPLVQNVTYQPTFPAPQTYLDSSAAAGSAYEYKLQQLRLNFAGPGTSARNAFGYVHAGREAPLVDERGTVLLVADQTIAGAISTELNTLKADLIGDRWSVQRIDVPRVEVPTGGSDPTAYKAAVADIRAQIKSAHTAVAGGLKAVFLIGHVPVPYSGLAPRDGNHFDHFGAWGCRRTVWGHERYLDC